MGTEPDDLEPGSIAIVGLAGRFPAARCAQELWALLREGREATRWLTPEELRAAGVPEEDIADPDYVPASLVLPDMEMFDAEFFGFSKRDAAVLDPQHRHFLECAWEALEDAGHMPESFPGAIGVFGGCGMQAYLPYNLLSNPQLVKSMGLFLLRHTGNDKDFLCSRVSYLLDLKGPSLSIQTACSTSLVAVHVAAQSLLSGECDMALAGGVSIELPHGQGYRHAQGEILSPDGHCRAFDDGAGGTLFGSGAGIVVLRRLEDAVRDGDNIYAVIRGSAVNNDGSQKAGYLAPSVEGQARAAVEALAVAGVEPGTVSYIEAHGTGTPVGDPIELAALAQAYGAGGRGFCGIGSLKTNIGHLDTAAGVASLIKVALALRHGVIPASLNFSRPNSRIDMGATPFQVVHQARPWARTETPRRAAVNSLGVGGTNAHVIVEEPPPAAEARAQEAGWQLLALSARSAASLERLKEKWSGFLAEPAPGFSLADAAYTTQVGRRAFPHRCAVVAQDAAGLHAALQGKAHARCATGKAASAGPDVVLMFPGGGAHYPGAGSELLARPAFSQAVNECFALMPADAPTDLRAVMLGSDARDAQAASKLEQPRYAIPALFTLEYALAKLWESWGVKPAAVIGHSAGEYAAACLAGVIPLQDALDMVVLRGQLFEAAPPGGMLSVDLSEAQLREAMEGLPLDVAAVNAADLCIASGSLAALAQLEQRLGQRGAEGRRLRINVAAHSRLLDGVLETFRARVSRIRFSAPSIPFVSNLTGTWADAQLLADPEYWVRHLREPVRFSDGLAQLLQMPDAALLEAGPGQGLCALARQNSPGAGRLVLASTGKAQEPHAGLALMLSSAGALWSRGKALDWGAVRGPGRRRRTSLPTYAFDHERHWVEPGLVREQAALPATSPAQAHGLKRLPSLNEWFMTPQWKAAPLPAVQPQTGRRWLVFGNDSKLTAAVVAEAARDGASVTLVRRGDTFARMRDGSFTVAPDQPAHYADLFRTLDQAGAAPDNILQLWPLDTMPGTTAGQLAGQTLAFDSLVAMAKAIQELDLGQPMRLTVVVAGSHAVRGEAVPHPERALALGPCRVIPREVPNITARLVDLESFDVSSEAVAGAVLREAQHPDTADLVAYRSGERWLPQLVAAAPGAPAAAPSGPGVRDGGVYLITGGLGDIALDLAGWLASTAQARLALVGRRGLPPQASWRALAASGDHSAQVRLVRRLLAFEAQGAQVQVFSADAADREAMARVVSACRARFGTINGVFHAAGVLDDGPIATKDADGFRRVLGPKACGAQVLHELLPPGDLDLFAVFSSTSTYLGPAGQVDYAAANAYLAALAASRSDGLCIHWGIWSEKGMAARAWRGGGQAHGAPKGAHPLLGAQVGSEDGAAFEASYAANDLWVLQEHSVAGRAVLPGTAYIEIARAAMMVLHPHAAIEIRSLSFEEAMVFEPASARRVRIELRRGAGGYDFSVRSRGELDEDWLEHARAGVGVFLGSLPAASPGTDEGDWRAGAIPQEHALAFGPRWRNIARMRLDANRATAQLELPARFAGDLAEFGAHPALTDMAATFGLHLLDAAERAHKLFVPLSIARVRLAAPVPAKLISRVELKGTPQTGFAAFDVSLHTPGGAPIATFEGFALRGVKPGAVSHQSAPRREPSLMDSMLACGIRGEDTHELFARVFSGGGPRDIVVSSIDIAALQRAISATVPKALPRKAGRAGAAGSAAALNPVEQALAEAWRELLGVEEIGTGDDFFALGGHSLAAVRLFARIRKQFAVDLPLATLFQAPTLGTLAAVVAETGGLDTGQAGQEPKKAGSNVIALVARTWSPLVAICRGRPERRPLFCVHGAGGNVLNFKIISDRLGQDQPFYGLQAQGVDGRLAPLARIEDMAAQYVEAVRGADAHGPYRLAGYSAGGVIALEMAQQLKKAGAEVELLAMIDTLSPTAARRKVSYLTKLWLMRHWSLKFALEWPARRRRGKLADATYAQALERLGRGEPLPPELVEFHLFRSFVAAQQRYEPSPYEGSIALFKASQADTQYLGAGGSLGWDEHIRGEIRVTEIGGSHFTMMAEPGVSELIEAIKRELARLDDHPQNPQTRAA